ncbi:MAG: rhomboid family intramembrane serine protease [Bacteroidia bacterium]|nr:rhomboid family intramembrane serine protease [Bacteroidia bacterium]
MDYTNDRGMGFRSFPPVTLNLLIINGLVFLAGLIPAFSEFIEMYFPLRYPILQTLPDEVLLHYGYNLALSKVPFQFITHMFTHADFFHLFFNMFGLWMFGAVVENYWKEKKFLVYYLICGLGAAGLYLGYLYLSGSQQPSAMVGASGALYGLLLAYGFMFPNNVVYINFFLPLKAKYWVMILIGFDLVAGFANQAGDNVAHFAHIGGALTGLLILLYWRKKGRLYWKNF